MTAEGNGTLLIVDDSTEILAVLSALLQPPYRALAATSGEEALRIDRRLPQPA